jgi:phosphoenolpyruvate carboxykinase (ATP)
MHQFGLKPETSSLKDLGLTDGIVYWNLAPEELSHIAVTRKQAKLTAHGVPCVDTGEFKGRSPQDRFIVKDELTETQVWWNNFNIPFEPQKFNRLYKKAIQYLNGKEFYVRDAYACADTRYRLRVRTITEYPWSSLFVYNMFLRPEPEELLSFTPEWTILCVPGLKANPKTDGTRQHNFSIINFTRKIILVGGSGYTGEIKKGMFSVLNFLLPQQGVLPMHCSANVGKNDDTALFFGLSGTGKTTLSADPERKLIGDDEHGWAPDNTTFNFEGGCYAKVINLTEEKEPDIFKAIKPGALLENVCFHTGTEEVDYSNESKTENTRVSYPLDHIASIQTPSIGHNPGNIFFLTCDAYGVLPPIARLSPGQAAFHFISGYTAKVAGTEAGINEPSTTFSACFGAPFMPLHPVRYAQMLSDKMKENNVHVWLVNTGWSGGPYGIGKRMDLKYTRALIKAALSDSLQKVEFRVDDLFGFEVPLSCPGVPAGLLDPRSTWPDPEMFDQKAMFLAQSFLKNFDKYAAVADEETLAGAPDPHRMLAERAH